MDVEDDFRRFVAARQRALLRTAFLLVGPGDAAEDLVQTALVRAWPHWGRVCAGEGAEAYVRRIMVNKASDWRRRRWHREVSTGRLPESAALSAASVELQQLMLSALRQLPPRQRAAVVLRYFDDVSEADTAAAMSCSVGTVKSTTSRALAALRRQPGLIALQLEGSAP